MNMIRIWILNEKRNKIPATGEVLTSVMPGEPIDEKGYASIPDEHRESESLS